MEHPFRRTTPCQALVFACTTLLPHIARADETPSAHDAPWHELTPAMGWPAAAEHDFGSSLTLALAFARTYDQRSHLAGSLLVNLPTAGWLGASRKAKSAETAKGQSSPAASNTAAAELEPCPAEALPVAEGERGQHAPVPTISSHDARAAIRAALRLAGLSNRRARLAELASRARWSAALPELRLRVTRLIDESSALSPTSYDAERRTERGGASLWLEARTTWRLDRALFSSAEIRLERLRYRSARDRRMATRDVLALLFDWQRAAAALLELSSAATPSECRAVKLAEQQLALELDLTTGGWFRTWARGKAERRPKVQCEQTHRGPS